MFQPAMWVDPGSVLHLPWAFIHPKGGLLARIRLPSNCGRPSSFHYESPVTVAPEFLEADFDVWHRRGGYTLDTHVKSSVTYYIYLYDYRHVHSYATYYQWWLVITSTSNLAQVCSCCWNMMKSDKHWHISQSPNFTQDGSMKKMVWKWNGQKPWAVVLMAIMYLLQVISRGPWLKQML